MKKFILLVTLAISALSFAQNGAFVEKTFTDMGKVLDFKTTMVAVKNLSTNTTVNHLTFESKGFAASDVKVMDLTKEAATEMIATMKNIKSKYFATPATAGGIEISSTNSLGHEIGATFVLDKTAATAPTTKKEKYYIETKEKYYEGKIVNHDASGSYIWKEVTGTAAKEITGKWEPFIRLNNNSSSATVTMTMEEFDSFVKFLEENAAKM
ncbi:MAG: hypothetical protein K0R65_1058 [Crocinitomicaceae bacterium]|jgi:hypothetical protein|nr:hypothetical protein [Crocinitomicaceae bacterium]